MLCITVHWEGLECITVHAVRVIWVGLYCAMHSVQAVRAIWSALQCITVHYSEGDMGWIVLCITVHRIAQWGWYGLEDNSVASVGASVLRKWAPAPDAHLKYSTTMMMHTMMMTMMMVMMILLMILMMMLMSFNLMRISNIQPPWWCTCNDEATKVDDDEWGRNRSE